MKFEFFADAVDTPPSRPTNPSVGYPSNGDPATGRPPTTPGAWFFYMLMVEFETLLKQNEIEPSAENLHQLADFFAKYKKLILDAADQTKTYSDLVTAFKDKIETVSDNVAAVTTTAANISSINGVDGIKDKIVTVSDNMADVQTNAANVAAIKGIGENLTEVLKSSQYAAEAKNWAEQASAIAGSEALMMPGATQALNIGQWMLRKAQCFHSVAEMKSSLVLADGMSCVTEGYYEPGDGGMGFYRIRPMTASDVDDGGSIHALQNGLCAELIDESPNVNQFGMRCYATKEDAEADIIGYASVNSRVASDLFEKRLIFLSGYYPFLDSIHLGTLVDVRGNGMLESTLVFTNSDGFVYDKDQSFCGNGYIRDLGIVSKGVCVRVTDNPVNVYLTTFERIYAESTNSDCFVAPTGNESKYGINCTFCINFKNVRANATDHDCFVNFAGLLTSFEDVSDHGRTRAVFTNCSGMFTRVNTSFKTSKFFMYFDSTMTKYTHVVHMMDCNAEGTTDSFIYFSEDCTTQAIASLILENTYFIPPTNSETPRTLPPIRFSHWPKYFSVRYSNIDGHYPDGYSESVKAPIYLYGNTFSGSHWNLQNDFDVYSERYSTVYKIKSNETDISGGGVEGTSYKTRCMKSDEVHANFFVGSRKRVIYAADSTTYFNSFMDCRSMVNPFFDEITLNFDSEKIFYSVFGRSDTVGNTLGIKNIGTANVTLVKWEGTGGFDISENIVLSPGDSITMVYKETGTASRWSVLSR